MHILHSLNLARRKPTNHHSQMSENDHFAALVRTSSPDLADDGFSTRVLSALPAQKAARVFYSRMIVCETRGSRDLSLPGSAAFRLSR